MVMRRGRGRRGWKCGAPDCIVASTNWMYEGEGWDETRVKTANVFAYSDRENVSEKTRGTTTLSEKSKRFVARHCVFASPN